MVTGGFESAGDAITGAVVAHAVEPLHGASGATDHGCCLNCGATLIGAHCHVCGQSSHIHRTLAAYGHDLLHGVFHFEGKIWNTLPMLAFKPGELTRRYIHGERAKFVSPLALFLFAVFLMFAVVNGLAGKMHVPKLNTADRAASLPQIQAQIKAKTGEIAAIDRGIGDAQADKTTKNVLDKRRNSLERDIVVLENARKFLKGERVTALSFNTKWKPLDAAIAKANENPNLLLYKVQSNAYKYSWALIPLSTPFVWLLFFWRRQYKIYDHAVFVTYSLTFMLFFVAFVTILDFGGLGDSIVPIVSVIVPPFHMYRQLRGAYQTSRGAAIARTFALSIFAILALGMFVVMLVALGVAG